MGFGVIWMLVGVAAVMVRAAVLEVTAPVDAMMLTLPVASEVARPVALMVARAVLEEVQATCAVRVWVEPSE